MYMWKSLDEAKAVIEQRCCNIDEIYSGALTLFKMMGGFVFAINLAIFVVAIVLATPLGNCAWPLWSVIAVLGVFFIELVASNYATSTVYNKRITEAKANTCDYVLGHCEEYMKMEDWQRKQVTKVVAPIAGLILKDNNGE